MYIFKFKELFIYKGWMIVVILKIVLIFLCWRVLNKYKEEECVY